MPPWGSRTNFATKVTINVYDLTPMNDWGHPFGLGAFHSGVEIDGREYTFAGGAGIHDTTPRDAPGATFREAVAVGTFDGGQPRLRECLEKLRPEFAPESYNIVTKNCNHFADALCRELLSAHDRARNAGVRRGIGRFVEDLVGDEEEDDADAAGLLACL